MNAIEQAIRQTEGYIADLDAKTKRCALGATTATSKPWRDRWLSALGTAAQHRENAVYLLNGLKAIQHRPEVTWGKKRVMLKVVHIPVRKAPARKMA